MPSRRANVLRLPVLRPQRQVAAGVEDFAFLISKAEKLQRQGKFEEAVAAYRGWTTTGLRPMVHAAWFNLGVLLASIGQRDEGADAYRRAIALAPDFLEPRLNLGSLLELSGNHAEAIATWEAAVDQPTRANSHTLALQVQALNHMGRVLENIRQYPEAESVLERSLAMNPAQPDVIQHWVHLRQKQCKWPVLKALPGLSVADLLKATSPLAMLAQTDDPSMQLLAANNFVTRKLPAQIQPVKRIASGAQQTPADRRLRIGYLSGDLCVHAVGLLLAEVIEQHDREHFEVHAFDYTHDDGSDYQARLRAAFDHRHAIRSMPDDAAAQLIADCGIDVLVDLQGLSSGARPAILAMRPAPVQVGWLGFIGTSAMPWIDFILADRFSATAEMQECFSEKILAMDAPLLPRDSRREAGAITSRAAQGLPEDKFVFASFNNAYKLNPQMFACWMEILRRVPNAVLWLLDDNPMATANLAREAELAGIDASRLIFAQRTGFADFIGRLQLADLFLDNHPYNAGSTARDALHAGLPMLTLSGRSLVSRMAGSLLLDAGLPELVTFGHAAYVEAAVSLANNPGQMRHLRERMTAYRSRDTGAASQTRALEQALLRASGRIDNNATLESRVSIEQEVQAQQRQLAAMDEVVAQDDSGRAALYQIVWSPETLASVKPPMRVLDNLANLRSDWREVWPIRRFLLDNVLDEDKFYGFFSPRFSDKTGFDGTALKEFIDEQASDVDVITFSPQADMGSLFLNVFEQAEVFDPGFSATAQAFFDSIGLAVDVNQLVMDNRHIVFSNYLAAKPRFWRQWLELTGQLFDVCEHEGDSSLKTSLLTETHYEGGLQRKVFLAERLTSVLLCLDPGMKVVRHPMSLASRSETVLGELHNEVVISDALKVAMRETGQAEYRSAFAQLREHIIRVHLEPAAA